MKKLIVFCSFPLLAFSSMPQAAENHLSTETTINIMEENLMTDDEYVMTEAEAAAYKKLAFGLRDRIKAGEDIYDLSKEGTEILWQARAACKKAFTIFEEKCPFGAYEKPTDYSPQGMKDFLSDRQGAWRAGIPHKNYFKEESKAFMMLKMWFKMHEAHINFLNDGKKEALEFASLSKRFYLRFLSPKTRLEKGYSKEQYQKMYGGAAR
ncbi:hypothetical protein PPO43_00160 [Saprospira sp. CCB-QB6]|uniref:hypothetical protein n=1 Tax=Saprospira sp. CCB-QB6 TaxID=3023936 RepID=UPI00234BC542|nr:hypothetical protein [Saprospira sp. CCB-QB6]WCL81508.1 hypothetical protein PPO43_00160 [Saprospira sp. CCB-QB6]